jgi:hypothetical protein
MRQELIQHKLAGVIDLQHTAAVLAGWGEGLSKARKYRCYGLRRNAHAAPPRVKMRPPVKAKKASMMRSPIGIWRAGYALPAARLHALSDQLCGSAPVVRLSGIGNGYRVRRFRIAHTG